MSNRNSNDNESIANNANPGFIRVKLLELDPPPTKIISLDPFCAVNIKELILSSPTKSDNSKFFFFYLFS
jgi:hypothetical protein